ncbi:hypothetical protein H7H78_04400 [Mycobacterium shinjukuense]|uniref:DUF7159 family protein n=1 Tax=Mycobacterium shinjukuense TaxID=398694 RepID=UPI0009F46DE4|nr:hypothetical protein [Mycobacterium shinjukuense]MCV6984704.1 hypothetical protein [Mycobacterium shinjukuense]ORB67470.1 hypothetical protein BST45_12275 [Mycobacterium shinjukuense]
MDTVLGLSVTPTAVGWVLAEGHGADGSIVSHHQMKLHAGAGVPALNAAARVAAEVSRASQLATADNRRLRVIGVTWNDDASAQAALLLEALTDAGFDNVVPVRLLDAVETLARAVAPIIGYEQTAVCILEHEWATVVMVDIRDHRTQSAVKQVRGGFDGLTSWLTGMFDRSGWRPAGVVVVGSDNAVSEFSRQLEKVLPVPVFAQSMAQVTVARGAALAAARSTEFTDAGLVAESEEPVAVPTRPHRRSYVGAAATLAAAAVTFVASVSLAVGLRLVPDEDRTAAHTVSKSVPPVAEAVAIPSPAPAGSVAPAAPQPPPQQEPVRLTGGERAAGSTPEERPDPAAPRPDANGGPLHLTRVLEHIPGTYGDSATQPPE